jgi:hypothetical protein
MHHHVLACPPVGHSSFRKSLSNITLGDVQAPNQLTKLVRPASATRDGLGMDFPPGELQKRDLQLALQLFAYPGFIDRTIAQHKELFAHSECWIYQFQNVSASGPFIYGLFITDGQRNLVDFCVDTNKKDQRKSVLVALMRLVCTQLSVTKRITH